MYFDWITWSVWTLGLILLLYWLFKTTREIKEIIISQNKQHSNKEGIENRMKQTTETYREITEQPAVWQDTLNILREQEDEIKKYMSAIGEDTEVILTGCGTSYYLPLTAASMYTKMTGCPARGVPASDILIFPETVLAKNRKYLLVAISRKGETKETNAAAEYVKEVAGGQVLAITCTPGSSLSQISDFVISAPAAAEKSKFMTKSFTSMLLAFQYLTALKTGDDRLLEELSTLPQHGVRLISRYEETARMIAEQFEAGLFVYLGQGPFYGLAAESMLKVKEMACTPAEAFHTLELMHGPKYALNEETLVTMLLSDTGAEWELPLIEKIKEFGARLKIICDSASQEAKTHADYLIELESGLSEYARFLLYLPVVQLFGYYRALHTGKEVE